MTLDELVAKLLELRQTHGGSTLMFTESDLVSGVYLKWTVDVGDPILIGLVVE